MPIDTEPVVVKDKLICLIEDCKHIEDSFRHLYEQVHWEQTELTIHLRNERFADFASS